MEKRWFFALFILLQIFQKLTAFGVGVGVGVGVDVGNVGGGNGVGGVVWIGGGIPGQNPSGSSNSKLNVAYTTLQAWKSAITDDPLRILDTWVGSNVCSYKGVFCAEDPQEAIMSSSPPGFVVAGIDLNQGNLQGTLVKELSLLSDLSLLHLNTNRFTGTVPYTFKDLSSLSELDLSNNHFSGTFPSVTLLLPNLIYLDLRFNNFSGPIPEDLFNKNLDAIFLNNNQFEGQIPPNVGNSPASVINLANNKLSGSIPASFGYMGSALKEALLLNNQLTGCIPEGIGFLTEMEVFDVSCNSLRGHLPNSISCLLGIEVLNFAHNKLSGALPDLICSLGSLVNLTVSYNFFSGFSEECTFRNLGFDFSGNCIPGRGMQRPEPECSVIPGGGLSCLRIPLTGPLICASIDLRAQVSPSPSSSYSLAPANSPP